jgi:hypothetical protein
LEIQKLHNVNNSIQDLQFKLTSNLFGKQISESPNIDIALCFWIKPRSIDDINTISKCLLEDFKVEHKLKFFYDVWNIASVFSYSKLPPRAYYVSYKCIYDLNKNILSKELCDEIDKYLND